MPPIQWITHTDSEHLRTELLTNLEDADPWWVPITQRLIALIEAIERAPVMPATWAVFSMYHLIFTISPKGGVGIIVRIVNEYYQFTYPIRNTSADQNNAIIEYTQDSAYAVEILAAMLQRLYLEHTFLA